MSLRDSQGEVFVLLLGSAILAYTVAVALIPFRVHVEIRSVEKDVVEQNLIVPDD